MFQADASLVDARLIEGCDYLDFGSHLGNSLRFGQEVLGGLRGVATENHPDNAQKLKDQGISLIEEDATKLIFPKSSFSFAVLSHFLEHLANLAQVDFVLGAASHACRDYLYIRQPYFDQDAYLQSLGLKTVSALYDQHTLHISTTELVTSLLRAGCANFDIWGLNLWWNSHDSDQILPSNARQKWTHKYDPAQMDAKEYRDFTMPIFEEIVCIVQLNDGSNANAARQKVRNYFGERLHHIISYQSPLRS